MRRVVVIAVLCAAFSMLIGAGIRSSFGLFQLPLVEQMGVGREQFSLAMAINNIIFGLPLAGLLADRFGPRWVLMAGGVVYTVGMVLLAGVTTPANLNLTLGLLIGLGLSATTYVVVIGAVGQLVPAEQRSRAFGFVTAMGSMGMLMMPLVTGWLLDIFGKDTTLRLLAVLAGLIVLLAFGLPSRLGGDMLTAGEEQKGEKQKDEPFVQVLKRAGRHNGYLLLTLGFFVCGFHVAFIGAHLPAFLSDNGMSTWVQGTALSLIGGFNIVGSYLFGWLGDFYRKKYLLSFLYFARAVVFALFFFLPITQTSVLLFASAIGFLWLATVPLTSGTVAQIFGARYLATLYGMVFFSHQVGAFLGVWLGGYFYDTIGTYAPVWYMSMALGVFASFVHLPISDEPLPKLQPSATSA